MLFKRLDHRSIEMQNTVYPCSPINTMFVKCSKIIRVFVRGLLLHLKLCKRVDHRSIEMQNTVDPCSHINTMFVKCSKIEKMALKVM